MTDTTTTTQHASDSSEQRGAERAALNALGERLGIELNPTVIRLDDGTRVEIDGASADRTVLVECSARYGTPRGAQPNKVKADALKLSWIAGHIAPRPTRLILLFVDDAAAAPFIGGVGWAVRAIRECGVEVATVELPLEIARAIRAAQKRQYR